MWKPRSVPREQRMWACVILLLCCLCILISQTSWSSCFVRYILCSSSTIIVIGPIHFFSMLRAIAAVSRPRSHFFFSTHDDDLFTIGGGERASSVPISITNGIMLLSMNDKYKHKYSTHRPRRVSETAETQRYAMLMGDPINRFPEENGSPSSNPTGRKEEVTCF